MSPAPAIVQRRPRVAAAPMPARPAPPAKTGLLKRVSRRGNEDVGRVGSSAIVWHCLEKFCVTRNLAAFYTLAGKD